MMEHSKVEEGVGKSGNETNRRLLQAYFDRCAVKEPVFEGVTGADGVTRDHREDGCERNLMTLFGRTVVRRQCYDKRGGKKLYPLDGALNLPPDLYSLGLRRRVAEGAMLNSFDEVTANVQRTTGGKVPKRQAEELVEKAAQDFQAFYGGRQAQAAEVTSDPLIMSLDGKGIRMRPASLRECTRKAAERDAHKMRTRLSPDEKGSRKRMSTVATIYSVEPHVRGAEEIMRRGKDRAGEVAPRARNKRVWASVACDHLTVTEEVLQEALRRDPERRLPRTCASPERKFPLNR